MVTNVVQFGRRDKTGLEKVGQIRFGVQRVLASQTQQFT
jgi:hypothetical protein